MTKNKIYDDRFVLMIPSLLKNEAAKLADLEKKSIAQVIRDAIVYYLKHRK